MQGVPAQAFFVALALGNGTQSHLQATSAEDQRGKWQACVDSSRESEQHVLVMWDTLHHDYFQPLFGIANVAIAAANDSPLVGLMFDVKAKVWVKVQSCKQCDKLKHTIKTGISEAEIGDHLVRN